MQQRIYHEEARRELSMLLTWPNFSHPRQYDVEAIFTRTYGNVGEGRWGRIVSDETFWLTVRSFAFAPLSLASLEYQPEAWHRWALEYPSDEALRWLALPREVAARTPQTDAAGRQSRLRGRLRPRGKEQPLALLDKRLAGLGWIRGYELPERARGVRSFAVYYAGHTLAAVEAERVIGLAGGRARDDRDHTVQSLRNEDHFCRYVVHSYALHRGAGVV